MRSRRPVPLHPFVLVAYQVLFVYAYNVQNISLASTVRSLVVLLAGALGLFLLAGKVTGDRTRAAVLVSFLVILVLSFDPIIPTLASLAPWAKSIRYRHELLLWLVIIAALGYLVVRLRSGVVEQIAGYLNVVAVVLLAFACIRIASQYVQLSGERGFPDRWARILAADTGAVKPDSAGAARPDIYYIILDQYPRQDLLRKYYHFDNGGFIHWLRRTGFFVADHSRCNYPKTALSVPCALNMEYLDRSLAQVGLRKASDNALRVMGANNRVVHFLKQEGYSYIYVQSDFDITGATSYADQNLPGGWKYPNEFERALLMRSVIGPTGIAWSRSRSYRLLQLERLASIPRIRKPTFTFAHIVCPHPPYVFDRNGPRSWLLADGSKDKVFVDQLVYVNKLVESTIDRILSASEIPPIIIMQADHGPKGPDDRDPWALAVRKDNATVDILTGIFNAYYFPGRRNEGLYESISPVNSFRVLFNNYFGTRCKVLDDIVRFPISQAASNSRFDPDKYVILRGLDSPGRRQPVAADP